MIKNNQSMEDASFDGKNLRPSQRLKLIAVPQIASA